jgi:hypothetical protein
MVDKPEKPANKPKRGRPRKRAAELTSDEALKKLFPKKAVETAKEEIKKADESSR